MTEEEMNLQAVKKSSKKISAELGYDHKCMEDIDAAKNEIQISIAMVSARKRKYKEDD